MAIYGDATIELVEQVFSDDVEHCVLLMRHSAREFAPGKHDLLNPLTDEGRELSTRLGQALPKQLMLRGYSSPAQRCIETADLILTGHDSKGGHFSRNRTVEALGVFYVLDQMKMYMAMREADGLVPFLERWFNNDVAADVMIPADYAAKLVARVSVEKLKSPLRKPQLDILVSHDMTIYTLRDRLLGQQAAKVGDVEFLDGLIFYKKNGSYLIQSHHGDAKHLSELTD
ncbi:MAG: histidine phosphatase family protein [bacterium]|nr:histidine phosphatase family protein [Gammaproteobacteria bacterium]HIL95272.1 histidine phosphatase family protein [Pseudomonadales bacterium]